MKESLFIVVKESVGELHVALPIVYFLKKSRSLNVFFVFFNEDNRDKLGIPDSYNNLINDLGEAIFGYSGVLKAFRERGSIFQRSLIMTCNSGSVNLIDLLHILCRKSLVLFYHHAYALHGSSVNSVYIERSYQKDSVMLLNSNFDEDYFKNVGFSSENLMLVGAPGYSREWIDGLNSKIVESDDFDMIVFVPLRAAHRLYLDFDSYEYLIKSLIKVFERFDRFLFLVKFHPRQKNVKELEKCFSSFSNVRLVYCSTFEAARASDLTLSFWSSAITDSLACGTPCIEFHRHNIVHDQLVERDGSLISLYRDLGLCEYFSNLDDLVVFMKGLDQCALKRMREGQYSKLSQIFRLDEEFEKELNVVFDQLFLRVSKASVFSGSKISSAVRLTRYFFGKMLRKV